MAIAGRFAKRDNAPTAVLDIAIVIKRMAGNFAGYGIPREVYMNNPIEQVSSYSASMTGAVAVDSPVPDSQHKVSAIYPSREEAEVVCQLLIKKGIAGSQIEVLAQHSPAVAEDANGEEGSEEVLKEVLIDGAIGTAVGTGLGALGTAALVASGITLFAASPVVAPLAMLGWFAGAGGLVGAAVGANGKNGKFSELVSDAIQAGNTVLVVHTQTESERQLAKDVIGTSFRGRDEVITEAN